MKGITVTLYERTPDGKDAFNRPLYVETPVEVHNVLVAPADPGGLEVLETLNLTGRRAIYTLGLPKGDSHNWEGNKVSFFGETWQVIGIPTEGIEGLIPLQWNKKVQVDRIE